MQAAKVAPTSRSRRPCGILGADCISGWQEKAALVCAAIHPDAGHEVIPIQITFHGLESSEELEAKIHFKRASVLRATRGACRPRGAHALGISIKTVDTHRARIMQKLEAHSIVDLVRYAVRSRLIDP